jgi:phage repressor protein C with HTH and peptisase S24 domain
MSEFQYVMPDASMAPAIPQGARIIFVTDAVPLTGDFVFVADAQQRVFVREFRELARGHWQAFPHNADAQGFDSDVDDVRVVGVFDGLRGRRGEVRHA